MNAKLESQIESLLEIGVDIDHDPVGPGNRWFYTFESRPSKTFPTQEAAVMVATTKFQVLLNEQQTATNS